MLGAPDVVAPASTRAIHHRLPAISSSLARRRGPPLLVGWLALAAPLGAQARPPLSIAADSTGALSAVRAVDIRQLCRCPVVLVDSIVRRSPKIRMFEVLEGPPAFRLPAAAVAGLRLAGHRTVPTSLRTITAAHRDTALLAVQQIPTPPPNARYLVVVTPPTGIAAAFLVALFHQRSAWRVGDVRSVLEP